MRVELREPSSIQRVSCQTGGRARWRRVRQRRQRLDECATGVGQWLRRREWFAPGTTARRWRMLAPQRSAISRLWRRNSDDSVSPTKLWNAPAVGVQSAGLADSAAAASRPSVSLMDVRSRGASSKRPDMARPAETSCAGAPVARQSVAAMQAARCPPADQPQATSGHAEPCVKQAAGGAHVLDDVGDRNLRAEPVAGHRDGEAARDRAGGEMAEARRMQASPVSAVQEDDERPPASSASGWKRSMN